MEATTLTRAAGSGPLSAAADMPSGKPIETPTAHSSTPTSTTQTFPARMNSTMPTTPRAVVTRMVRTRPRRSTMGPPKIRVIASLAANAAANSAATAAACPCPFRTASVSQLPADPSPSSTPSMTTPMSSSRQSSQPRSHWRTFAPRSCCGSPAGARLPPGIPAAIARAAAAMRTASVMTCAAGEMPRAAQAAPIPAPTATPMDQAACIIGMRVRPAACSTAEPSTLISTSRVPMPSPTTTKANASSGTQPAMSARPMTVIAAAMRSSAPVTARRLPSQCKTGVDASSPKMAPTVTPARSSPIVAVPMPRLALIAGSRGPHAETVIPPSPNAAVIVHRQRTSVERSGVSNGIRHRSASPKNFTVEDIMDRPRAGHQTPGRPPGCGPTARLRAGHPSRGSRTGPR